MAEEQVSSLISTEELKTALETDHKTQDGGLWDVGVPIHRTNAVPLDVTSVLFKAEEDTSLEETAKNYANTNLTAYPGQLITVLDTNSAASFVVQPPTHKTTRVDLDEDNNKTEEVENCVVEQVAYKSYVDFQEQQLRHDIDNLTAVMNFRGAFESFTAAADFANSSTVNSTTGEGIAFKSGDVIVITGTEGSDNQSDGKPGMEYVCTGLDATGKAIWTELGFGSQLATFLGGSNASALPTQLPYGEESTYTPSTVIEYIKDADNAICTKLDNLILDTKTVLMADDLRFTINFGKYTTKDNKPYTISKFKNGKDATDGINSLHDLFVDAFSQIFYPKTNYPTVTVGIQSHTTDTGTNEVGSYIKTINWHSTTTSGSYVGHDGTGTYGSSGGTSEASGLSSKSFSYKVSNNKDAQTSNLAGGTFTFPKTIYEDPNKGLQITSTTETAYATLYCTATLDPSSAYTPYDNTGTPYEAGKITSFEDGTTEKSFNPTLKITGFRNSWYYVGTDCTSELTSDFIRSKATAKNKNTTSFGTLTIPAGTKRVMIAIPGTHTLKSVIDVDGQNLDVKANFTTEIIAVEGANGYQAASYTVFHFENENGIAATKYTFSIT